MSADNQPGCLRMLGPLGELLAVKDPSRISNVVPSSARTVETEHGFKVQLGPGDPDAMADVIDLALTTRHAVSGQIDKSGNVTIKEIK